MRRGTAGLLAALLLIPLAGCSNTQVDVESLTRQFAPIVIKLAPNALPVLPPWQRAIVTVGVFVLDKQVEAASREPELTYLHVRQTVDGVEKITVFAIESQQRLRVELVGTFTQEIKQRRIVIRADPQTESTIVVSEAIATDPVYHADTVVLTDLLTNAERLDFDSGHHADENRGNLGTTADAQFPGINPLGWKLLNGAVTQPWREDVLPDRYRCATLPADGWQDSLFETPQSVEEWQNSIGEFSTFQKSWCLRTSAGRYGFLHTTVDEVDFTDLVQNGPTLLGVYVIWADPSP